jgi:exosome complex exonuclease DIS3/RRP44
LKNADQLLDMVSAGREQRENKSAKNERFYPEVGENIAAFF